VKKNWHAYNRVYALRGREVGSVNRNFTGRKSPSFQTQRIDALTCAELVTIAARFVAEILNAYVHTVEGPDPVSLSRN
jgi:hypothetical protein